MLQKKQKRKHLQCPLLVHSGASASFTNSLLDSSLEVLFGGGSLSLDKIIKSKVLRQPVAIKHETGEGLCPVSETLESETRGQWRHFSADDAGSILGSRCFSKLDSKDLGSIRL